MKTNLIICIVLLSTLFFSCNGCTSNDDEPFLAIESPFNEIPEEPEDYLIRSYFIEDSLIIPMKVYVPNYELFPLLDSIVQIVRNCSNPRRTDLALVNGGKMALSFSVLQRNGYTLAKVRTISMHMHDFSNYNAFFDHHEFRFYYQGDYLNRYFERTNEITHENYIDPSKLISMIDDRDYEWDYVLKDSTFVAYSYKDCDKFWTDWEIYNKIYNSK